ncbi:hypothetical protein RCL1_003890 [Eukaryota sp. TZLM3-RCL]
MSDLPFAWYPPRSSWWEPPPPIDVDALNNLLQQFRKEYSTVSSYLARWVGSLDLLHFGKTIKRREVVIAVIASSKNPVCNVGYYKELPVLPLTENQKPPNYPIGFDLQGLLSDWMLVSFDEPYYERMKNAAHTLREKLSDCYFVLPMCTYRRTEFRLFAVVPHSSVRPVAEDFKLPRIWDHFHVEYVHEIFLKDTLYYPNSERLYKMQTFIGVPFRIPSLGCNIGTNSVEDPQVGGTLGSVVFHQNQQKIVTAARVAQSEGQTTNICALYQPNNIAYEHYKANCELLGQLPSTERPKLLCRDDLIVPSDQQLASGYLPTNVNCINGLVQFSSSDRRALDIAIVAVEEQGLRLSNEPQLSESEWITRAKESRVGVTAQSVLPESVFQETVLTVIQCLTKKNNPFPVKITGFARDNFLQEFWDIHGHVPFPVFKIGATTGLTFGGIYYSSTLAETPGLFAEVELWRTVHRLAVFSWGGNFAEPGDSGAAVCSLLTGDIIGFLAEWSSTVTSVLSISSVRKVWPDLELST